MGDTRELGRIQTNRGFALALDGELDEATRHLDAGHEHSVSVGDRRRQTQAVLYSGLVHCARGALDEGSSLIVQAADVLRLLGDGRYFIPAFCWALQLEGIVTRTYPAPGEEPPGYSNHPQLATYAQEHPEFGLYHEFWWRYLSRVLPQ
jgi:hypothetical protein